MMRLVPIVEGFGEARAVPILMYRWLSARGLTGDFYIPDLAINAKGCGKLKADHDPRAHRGIEHYISQALRARPDAIVALLDADDECLKRTKGKKLGPELLERARAVAGRVPVAVVVANREFEAWFIADLPSLKAAGLIAADAALADETNPERRAGCKSAMGKLLGETYEPTVHQAELVRGLEFTAEARRISPSYDKLVRELDRLTALARKRRTS
jgi:hypothetical protein